MNMFIVVIDLPDRVLHVITVKSNEEAHDGEEHDGIGSHHQATRSALDLKYKSLDVIDDLKSKLKQMLLCSIEIYYFKS